MSENVAATVAPGDMPVGQPQGASSSASWTTTSAHLLGSSPAEPAAEAPSGGDELPQAAEGVTAQALPPEERVVPVTPAETIAALREYNPAIEQKTAQLAEALISRALASPPSAADLAASGAQCMDLLRAQHGPKADTILQMARDEMVHMTKTFPGLPEILDTSGYGNSAWLIGELAKSGFARRHKAGR